MPRIRRPDVKRKQGDAPRTIPPAPQEAGERESALFPIVGIGASAGGFEAFSRMLETLPHDTGMAFVFVQHMEPEHKSMLPRLFSKITRMTVTEAQQGMVVESNHVYVIPPKADMGILNGVLQILGRKKSGGRYMPVDYFLCSLAEDIKNRAIGVILSGTASDGTIGLKAIKSDGGFTFAQDEESSKYYGMPGSAITSGCVDFVLPPDRISRELAQLARHPYIKLPHHSRLPEELLAGEDDFSKILFLLRRNCGVDFGYYKPGTVRRRIARRMTIRKIGRMKKYMELLQNDRAELEALSQDIFVHVTCFFREPVVYKLLQTQIFPAIVSARSPDEAIRIWVPGCSTGEEVYSLAIALLELLGDRASPMSFQIFGTDISEHAIEKARCGEYSEASLHDISPSQLRRFFVKTASGHQINKAVREMCLFARQDLLKDPPFSRLDLISCRNVLIYLEVVAQKRIISSFHYALRDTGFLLLGKSESLAAYSNLFTPADKKVRVFIKKPNAGIAAPAFPSTDNVKTAPLVPIIEEPPVYDALKEADRLVWQRYSHSGLVMNDDLEILHFRGETSPYLSPDSGRASMNVLHMVHDDLRMPLRSAIHKARRVNAPVRSAGIRMHIKGGFRDVGLEVTPLMRPGGKERHFIVLFDELQTAAPAPDAESPAGGKLRSAGDGREMLQLKRELNATREYLQSVVEQQDAVNEELKSANEEILSSNEELQSTNEELETAKEELQASNEELITVNDTLQARNAELTQIGDDLDNVLTGTDIPVLIVGADLRIRRFTRAAEKLLNLLPGDVGRPIGNMRLNIELEGLEALLTEACHTLLVQQQDVRAGGCWHVMQVRPYKTAGNKIDGVLIAFYDIDNLKQSNDALRESEATVSALLDTLIPGIFVVGEDRSIVMVSSGAERIFGYKRREMLGRTLDMLLPDLSRSDHIEHLAEYFTAVGGKTMMADRQTQCRRKDGSHIPVEVSISSIQTPKRRLAVVSLNDLTELKRAEAALAEKEAVLRLSEQELHKLTGSLISAQEEERQRVAEELHDDLNQKLAELAWQADTIAKEVPDSASGIEERVLSLSTSLSDLSDEVRRMAHDLHPSILKHFGLIAALRSFCEDFSKREDIKVLFRHRHVPESIPANIALCLYRVAQECLHNIARHSGAKEASIVMAGAADAVRLAINDKGIGFNPEEVTQGIGLVSIKERLRIVGGSVFLSSMPGKGACIEVSIPLKAGEL
jgi:two-component system, chemotaxis family, CheB/CheR fusion protein